MKPTRGKLAAHKAWQRHRGHASLPIVDDVAPRPTTRAECLPGGRNAIRPCPYVSCRYHLLLDVRRSGSLRFNFRTREVGKLSETCALDVADRGGHSLEDVGKFMGVTRERVRQLVTDALARMRRRMKAASRGW